MPTAVAVRAACVATRAGARSLPALSQLPPATIIRPVYRSLSSSCPYSTNPHHLGVQRAVRGHTLRLALSRPAQSAGNTTIMTKVGATPRRAYSDIASSAQKPIRAAPNADPAAASGNPQLD